MNIAAASLPISFTIDSSMSDKDVDGVLNAAYDWNEALGREAIRIVPRNGFVVRKLSPSNFTAGQEAVTHVQYSGSYIVWVGIDVNQLYTTVDIESLMIHEFGHAMGLAHIKGTVMDPYLGTNEIRRTVDPQSIEAVRCLYGP